MGAVENAVQAILANGALTADQKAAQIQQAKANALNQVLTGHLPYTFTQAPWSVTVSAATVVPTPMGSAISLTVSATKSGVPVPVNNPVVLVNPPVLIPDPAGTITRTGPIPAWQGGGTVTRTFTEDPVTALRQLLVSTLDAANRQ